MTQQYTPVTWQDETTSQQGTLINAERLNQMQTAHHYADGFEEVDAVPTADPGVAYHKVVYCTADSTFYRWDGTAWTADIDDETKALLQQEIARATAAESVLHQQLEDEHDARVGAEAAINDRITDEATELAQRIATETSTRYTADTALGTRITNETTARETADTNLGNRITAEATARAEADTLLGNRITDETTAREGADTALGNRITAEETRATQAEQANAQAIANTYTKAEADTLLAGKADQATTYTKTETDTLLASKADSTALSALSTRVDTLDAGNVKLTGNQDIPGIKTFTSSPIIKNGTALLELVDTDDDGTTAPASLQFTGIRHWDKNNVDQGGLYFTHTTAGSKEAYLQTLKAGGGFAQLRLISESNGDNYATAPVRAYAAGNTTDVATIATLDQYTPMVRTTGNQPIYGKKDFEQIQTSNVFRSNSIAIGSNNKWRKVATCTIGGSANHIFMVTSAAGGWPSFGILHTENDYGAFPRLYWAIRKYNNSDSSDLRIVDCVAMTKNASDTEYSIWIKGGATMGFRVMASFTGQTNNNDVVMETEITDLDDLSSFDLVRYSQDYPY